jgi:transcriptional regulator with PAS, ATPase and Fis domain
VFPVAKKIILITGTENTRSILHEQLENYIGDLVQIESYATNSGIDKTLHGDLVVISTELIYKEALKAIGKDCPIILARRILNYTEIEKILFIPKGEKVLFVNDDKETALDCINWLERLGINHISYTPCYPDCPPINNIEKFKIALTPGEVDLVPQSVLEIININTRLIDITTVGEILKHLDIFEEKWHSIYENYMGKIIELAKGLAEISQEKAEAYRHVNMVIDGVREGILAFNNEGIITVFNENLKFLLGIKKTVINDKNLREIITDSSIMEFLLNGEADKSGMFNIRGADIFLSKFKIKKEGVTIATFKDMKDTRDIEIRTKKELYSKGYYGKYTFNDILGTSAEIKSTINIAKKLASSDLTLLIEGESGTGKELFSSAIHNQSIRRDGPFIAVNFSSITENLVESELFGYQDGAFTGAVKGGKPGLFEQADGGTILLDEIGDASLKVQTRLLRVLEEKEIMRIGGTRIIPVDVRIIAATNQNLLELVEKGLFRADLYHRLKVLYIKLPSLRHRREDIILLLKYFMEKKGIKHIKIENEVIERLKSYPWYGNVRELRNTIDYMIAVCDGKTISPQDLPGGGFFEERNHADNDNLNVEIMGDYRFILQCLYIQGIEGKRGSRKSIMEEARVSGIFLSEQMIRHRLDTLEELGYVAKEKGRGGTVLTPFGFERTKGIMEDNGSVEKTN